MTALDIGDLFHLLRNDRRRHLLRLVDERGDIRHGDAAEVIAAEENETTVTQLEGKERQAAYVTLYQNHLPELVDAGVINWEQKRLVTPGRNFDVAIGLLNRAEDYLGDDGLGSRASEFARGLVGGGSP